MQLLRTRSRREATVDRVGAHTLLELRRRRAHRRLEYALRLLL